MRIFSNRNRPVHLGRFPLERLPRAQVSEEMLLSFKKQKPEIEQKQNVLAKT